MELSSCKIKKFIIFPETEIFSLMFFLYFRRKLPKFKKKSPTPKKFLIFQEMEFYSPKLKKLISQEGTLKSQAYS